MTDTPERDRILRDREVAERVYREALEMYTDFRPESIDFRVANLLSRAYPLPPEPREVTLSDGWTYRWESGYLQRSDPVLRCWVSESHVYIGTADDIRKLYGLLEENE